MDERWWPNPSTDCDLEQDRATMAGESGQDPQPDPDPDPDPDLDPNPDLDPSLRVISINSRKLVLGERRRLGSGLGGQVWTAALALSKQLDGGTIREEDVRGQTVLEVGSGCGLGGMFALELGADKVW